MENTEQSSDSTKQALHNEDIYELRLYVAGNSSKSKLALDNLKEICYKYLKGKCHIEVVDLREKPSLARADQIVAISTLMRKGYPGRKIVGDLSNPGKVLEVLNLHTSSFTDIPNQKSFMETISSDKSKSQTVRSRKSKDDLQPYIGSGLHMAIPKFG